MAPNDIDSDLTDLETFWLCDQTQIKRCCEDSLTMLMKASVGPTRLSVSGRIQRRHNGVESFHNIFGNS